MKVIFMDHDGVICLESEWGSRFDKQKKYDPRPTIKEIPILDRFDNFNRSCVECLNQVIRDTDCEIVISSDWRTWATLEEIGEYYESQGIIKKPIGLTPFMDRSEVPPEFEFKMGLGLNQTRVLEIRKWLDNHPHVVSWVAIDDMRLGEQGWGLEHFVLSTDHKNGICNSEVKTLLIEYLNQPVLIL